MHAVLMGRQPCFMESLLAEKGEAMAESLAMNTVSWLPSNDLTGLDANSRIWVSTDVAGLPAGPESC
ncbi:MAG: hypothetical protein HY985_07150 [Magnetospirillum sp.]|nr:hypothetical protein [Magnetospirillum sp.]